ncbi:MAG: hypothetical protein KBC96_11955 [Armatimonadetes bacterium]|nr:hypothetical protein [Armatimonadota bacterium]
MTSDELAIYCIDIGSVAAGNFAWARGLQGNLVSSQNPAELVTSLAGDLNRGLRVTLGLECPLFVAVREKASDLTKCRDCEVFADKGGKRRVAPWSAGPGCGSMGTGIVQSVWVLKEVRRLLHETVPVFLDWGKFEESPSGLFLWEAFINGVAKATTHEGDALIGVKEFSSNLPNIIGANVCHEKYVHSLIGAALLRTGWSQDLSLLSAPCIVIRA